MTDLEKKSKIADIIMDAIEEYNINEINRPMIPSIYAGKILDSLQEELVSKELEEEIKRYLHKVYDRDTTVGDVARHFAKWQKEHLWKPADGDDLPIIDREVIALLDNGKVVFAHRPPEFWDGKDIVTGKVTRNYPKTYDKGGWNIPNIKYWLDCSMPKEIGG